MKTKIILRIIIIFFEFITIQNEIFSQKDTISNKASIIEIKDIKISWQSKFQGKYFTFKQSDLENLLDLENDSKNIEIFWNIDDKERKETDTYLFAYIFHGHDIEWRISDKSEAKYTSLPSGKYKFEIKCFKNGIWTETRANNFMLTVKPKFYFTPWFIIFYAIGITLFVLIIIKVDKSSEIIANFIFWAAMYFIIVCFNLVFIMDGLIQNPNVTFNEIVTEVFLIPKIFKLFFGLIVNFYLFYFFLVPRFLFRKKIVQFILYAILSSIVVGFLFRFIWLVKIIPYAISAGYSPVKIFLPPIILALIFGFLGLAVKKIVLWRKSVAEKISLNKKLYASKTALIMLQAQLNPHFLFNSLNNIDILVEENPKTASEYLKKLSDILRYVLYETKETETKLSKEIDQIKSYIELQKIRTENPHYVNFVIKGEIKDQKIAPMIFIPFVENAFKHCKNKSVENAINIEFEINEDSIKMNCKNYYEESKVEVIKSEGLGIETIKQRLNLLYPKNHELVIERAGNWFSVGLSVNL